MTEATDYAAKMLATKTGVGMKPPFFAETASAKGDQSWPLWIVRNATCNSLGRLMSRGDAEAVAEAMNRLSGIGS